MRPKPNDNSLSLRTKCKAYNGSMAIKNFEFEIKGVRGVSSVEEAVEYIQPMLAPGVKVVIRSIEYDQILGIHLIPINTSATIEGSAWL